MPEIETVTSAANPLLKDVRRAIARGGLTSGGMCIAEGFHLLDEALRSGLEVPIVLFSEGVEIEAPPAPRTIRLPAELFQSIAATETSQGVMALVRLPEWDVEQLFGDVSLLVVLDGIQDPGNAGAIVRSAEAFGATGVVFAKGTVSPHHPKALRASAGSVFRVPFVTGMNAVAIGELLARHHVASWCSVPWTGKQCPPQLDRACALIIGNEARGVGEELRAVSEEIAIPTVGVESLNAAMAASILLYEARRQRR